MKKGIIIGGIVLVVLIIAALVYFFVIKKAAPAINLAAATTLATVQPVSINPVLSKIFTDKSVQQILATALDESEIKTLAGWDQYATGNNWARTTDKDYALQLIWQMTKQGTNPLSTGYSHQDINLAFNYGTI
jgi:hypothetical protein